MISTVIIVAALVVALWMLLKFKEVRHRLFGAVLIILLLVFFISASQIIKSQNIDLTADGGFKVFLGAYKLWLGQAFGNIKAVTGNAIGMNWKLNQSYVVEEIKNKN